MSLSNHHHRRDGSVVTILPSKKDLVASIDESFTSNYKQIKI